MKKRLLTSFAVAVMLTSTTVPVVNHVVINHAFNQRVSAATADQTAFLNKAAKQAIKAAKKYGTYPSVMIAQAIVESGWDKSGLAVSANNLFGMKTDSSWTGETYSARTREEGKNGKSYYITASFRKYPSFEQSFEDNGDELRNGVSWDPLRYKGTWIENASTYASATKALTGTYATDSKYDATLNNYITSYNLTKYDPVTVNATRTYTATKNSSTYNWPTSPSIASAIGTVKAGEKVTVTKTITFYDGSTRMYVDGRGWVNGSIFIKASSSTKEPVTQAPKNTVKTTKNLMHNAYVYDKDGNKLKGKMFKTSDENGGKMIDTYGTATIKGKSYYRVGENEYIAAGNIDGTLRFLKHGSYVYNQYGNRDNNLKHKKDSQIATYGSAIKINGKKYYKIGIRQYVKKANFM